MKDLFPSTIQQIEEELRKGNKIQAIKIYKEATGEGLLEAKQVIDGWNLSAVDEAELWRDKFEAPSKGKLTEAQIQEKIRAYLQKGQKLEAIKWVRELHKWDLKRAKEYIDTFDEQKKTQVFLPPASVLKEEPIVNHQFIAEKDKKEYHVSSVSFENNQNAEMPEFQQATHKEGKIEINMAPLTYTQSTPKAESPFIVKLLIALALTALASWIYSLFG